MNDFMKCCTLCPRLCCVDRTVSRGFCGESDKIRIARAALHFWEEPCISGTRGSGTVFFSGCNLGCIYCQNKNISSGEVGREISESRLTEIYFELAAKGAHNINLVTPTHFAPQIKSTVTEAKRRGFSIPFVWNTSGYERAETILSLDRTVDIYLTDFKYLSSDLALKYSHAGNYPEAAKAALEAMVKTKGKPVIDSSDGLMKRGVIVRHLVLPGCTADSLDVIKYLSGYGEDIIVSIMSQYTPPAGLLPFPGLNRKTTKYEYMKAVDYAIKLGIKTAYMQEGETAKESFIPDFDYEGV